MKNYKCTNEECNKVHKSEEIIKACSCGCEVREIVYEMEVEKEITADLDIQKLIKEVADEYIEENEVQIIRSFQKVIKKELDKLKPTVVQVGERPIIELKGRLHKKFKECLQIVNVERQLFISGAAGTGKTTLASHIAEAMQLNFASISCSAGLSEGHLLGRMLFDGTYIKSEFVDLFENGGVFLFDEIDAADSNTMLVINSALANGILSVPNRKENPKAKRHQDFICICAGNTWGNGSFEYHGRNHLDAAFLDRFAMSKVHVDYDNDFEKSILSHEVAFKALAQIRQNINDTKIRRVLSTRAFISAQRQLSAGISLKEIIDRLFLGWSKEEVTKSMNKVILS